MPISTGREGANDTTIFDELESQARALGHMMDALQGATVATARGERQPLDALIERTLAAKARVDAAAEQFVSAARAMAAASTTTLQHDAAMTAVQSAAAAPAPTPAPVPAPAPAATAGSPSGRT